MADNTLNVEIKAEVDGLVKGLSEAEKSLKTFEKSTSRIEEELKRNAVQYAKVENNIVDLNSAFKTGKISVDKYENELKDLTRSKDSLAKSSRKLSSELISVKRSIKSIEGIKKTSTEVQKAGQSFDKLGKSVKVNANPSVIEFSRVIQDAPFGILGVANNIQQLTANFGDLSRQAGGSKKAFQAFLGAFTGTSGILFVVSLVTTAFISYGDELKALTNKTEKLNQKQKKLVDRLNAVSDAIGAQISALQSTKALYEAQGKPIENLLKKELSLLKIRKKNNLEQLKALKIQLENEKKSAREISLFDGLKKLAKAFGDSFTGNIVDETDAERWERIRKSMTDTASLEKRFKSFGIDDKEAKKIAEVETNIANIEKSLAEIDLDVFKIENPDEFKLNTSKSKKEVKKTFGVFQRTFLDQIPAFELKAKQEFAEVSGKISEALTPKGVDLINFNGLGDKAKEGLAQLTPILSEGITGLNEKISPLAQKLNETALSVIPKKEQLDEKKQAYLETLNSLGSEIEGLLEGSLGNALADVGASLGEALATGQNVLSAVGTSLLNSLAGFLSNLGKLLIQYGVAGLLYSKATKALLQPLTAGPAAIALIGAGVALTAIGGAISGALKGGGASGGGSSSGGGQDFSSAGTGQSFASTPNIASSGSAGGNFVFEIAGTKLIGVLKNTLDRNKALGGQNNLLFA
jgi:hypothetical protein